MFCKNCGNQIDDKAVICPKCGVPVGKLPPFVTQTVPNHLALSILVTIFCCFAFGIPAIVCSAQVNGKVNRGDIEGAMKTSSRAKMWILVSFCCGLVFQIIYGILIFLSEV